MIMRFVPVAVLLLMVSAGCSKTASCRPGTVLLSIDFRGSASADQIILAISVNGGTAVNTTLPHKPGTDIGTVEIDFSGKYPANDAIDVTATALIGGTQIDSAEIQFTATAGCTSENLAFGGNGPGADLSTNSGPDFAGCMPLTMCPASMGCGQISDNCGGMLSCGDCVLAAIEEAVANVGDTVLLEGTFNSTVTVNFGGGVQAPATVLGTHRASVQVPTGAITGPVSVTTGNQTVGALPLRVATFKPGLNFFMPFYDQAEGARQTTGLVRARQGTTAVVVRNHVYVIGGAGDTLSTTSVESALISADGSLSPFALVGGLTLQTGRFNHTALVIGSYVYVFGGLDSSSKATSSIERSAIASDGTLGPFMPAGTLGTPRAAFTTTVVGNRVYAVGGVDANGTALGTIESATIAGDGTLSAFSPVASTLVTARSGHAAHVVGNNLYVIAGSDNSIEQAAINADGTIGAFSKPGILLASAVNQPAAVVLGTHLVLIGGSNSGNPGTTVQQASVAGGVLGSFTDQRNNGYFLSTPRAGEALVVANNQLYAIGGTTTNNVATSLIERSQINGSGLLSTFTQTNLALKVARFGHTATVIGNNLYIIGGYSGGVLGSIEQATVNPDGTLGAFNTLSITLQTAREFHTAAVIGPYLYVVGGDQGTYPAPNLPVERSAINAVDGTLGPFSNDGTLEPVAAHYGHSSAVIGGSFFIFDKSSSESATISASGDLSAFSTLSGVTSTDVLHGGAILQNYVYSLGGQNLSNTYEIDRATIASFTPGAFSAVNGVSGPPPWGSAIEVIGGGLFSLGGRNGGNNFFPDVDRAAISSDGTVGNYSQLTANYLNNTRAYSTATAVGNYLWIIGGMTKDLQNNDVPINVTERAQLQ